MKKVFFLFSLFLVFSCANKSKLTYKQPLVEILTQQENGGANIRFFEIISERAELNMLLNDSNLKRKIKPNDIETSNFIVMSFGPKYKRKNEITILETNENHNNIVISFLESESKNAKDSLVFPIYPYTVLKINSKKEIIFK